MPLFVHGLDEYNTGTVVNCEKEGHCWHQGTAVGSLYCSKCGAYTSYLYPNLAFSYPEYMEKRKQEIDNHPEWGIKYL